MKAECWSIFGLLALSAAMAGCEDPTGASAIGGPSRVVNRGQFVGPHPVALVPVAGVGTACITGTSFAAPFALAIGPTGTTAVTLAEVRSEFVNTDGVRLSAAPLGPAALEQRFGALTVPSFSSRVFDFPHHVPCSTRSAGRLTVHVVTRDGHGAARTSTLHAHAHAP